jgi:tRNA G18 (ribose-2'-O)-methylase SpoU
VETPASSALVDRLITAGVLREYTAAGAPPFVAEGRFVVRRLLALPRWRLRELLLTAAAERALHDDLARVDPARRPTIHLLEPAELNRLGGFHFHQGCLGFADRPAVVHWRGLELAKPEPRNPIIVLESVRDPDNVGSIFRSALGFGARAVLLSPGCADPLYRKTVRTSMAAVLALPFAEATPWPAMLGELRAAGLTIVALTPETSAEPLPEAAATLRTSALVLIAGTEGDGLSPAALAAADRRVRIPMQPALDSFNVATAVSIALYALSTGAR